MILNLLIALFCLTGVAVASAAPLFYVYRLGRKNRQKTILQEAVENPAKFDLWILRTRQNATNQRIRQLEAGFARDGYNVSNKETIPQN